jgi:hypothetical protein
MIIEYRHLQLTLIRNPTPPLQQNQCIPLPRHLMWFISSRELEASPTPPSFLNELYEYFSPNPPNSPIHFPIEILCPNVIFNPQYLDIWFMSSEPSQPPCDTPSTSSPPENNPTVTITKVTPLYPLYFRQFHCDEDIPEELNKPDRPWDALHNRVLFPSQEALTHPNQKPIYVVENKYFLPSEHIYWFNNPIHTPKSFEEGNMAKFPPPPKSTFPSNMES